ncbi:hypothetical protein EMIHUDRAFT_200819 [Emiliania huxleyi CCMP1516]|uniref:Secreted protein n=2 Tax=Emiliania huxleyi TaxID=2903 RepID=A0A0D3KR75_EMIH1|nr:hypothetical protein EMIHUDRAFT_200819 [Emiliania huxleyi CCMP1516]EOD38260.1 hypothetical protein EMIHUDRAFT_200819 [Emiliania huxleyi CCMP1516]|eukprot:XP_005790689.1 hypothetical protein EMIHUDRAFT_200819 [Emiliania huxleyi CCMP1516]
MRPLPSFLLLCASYGVTAIAYGFPSGKHGLDYCIAEADTTSDMTASTTMAPPPWTSLAPSIPSESAICFDDPIFDFFLAICRLQTSTSALMAQYDGATTHEARDPCCDNPAP